MNPSITESPPPEKLLKAMPTLGHAVVLWRRHAAELLRRWNKRPEAAGAAQHLRCWEDLGAPEIDVPQASSTFQLGLGWSGPDHPWFLLDDDDKRAASIYLRRLLHLPALRMFWIQSLREQRFLHLTRHVPKAWHKEEVQPPPGSVVAGLNIANWEELPGLIHASSHRPGGPALEMAAMPGWIEERPLITHRLLTPYEVDAAGTVRWIDDRF